MGLGGNSGMESVVVLCNHLHKMLQRTPPGKKPSLSAIKDAFEGYQNERLPRAREVLALSGQVLRMQSGESLPYKVLANDILPWVPDRVIASQFGDFIVQAPKLDFLDASGFPRGSRLWRDQGEKGAGSSRSFLFSACVVGAVAVAAASTMLIY